MELFARRYNLSEKLGRGGMGTVWLAECQTLRRKVAIKLLDPSVGETSQGRERFDREARALASIDSRYVVKVLDYGVHDGTPFVAMEHLVGEDLGARLRRVRRFSPRALAPIVDQLAKGLSRAHAIGLVHRDIKPPNIFLVVEDGETIVKLIDFGIVKVLRSDPISGGAGPETLTGTNDMVGTPHYMSPEQIRSAANIDHRTDLWALAVTIYRCLTGHAPFDGPSAGDVLVRICTDPTPRGQHGLGPELDAFFERALAKKPDDRFQDVRDLAAEFCAIAQTVEGPTSGTDGPPTSGSSSGYGTPSSRRFAPPSGALPSGVPLFASPPPPIGVATPAPRSRPDADMTAGPTSRSPALALPPSLARSVPPPDDAPPASRRLPPPPPPPEEVATDATASRRVMLGVGAVAVLVAGGLGAYRWARGRPEPAGSAASTTREYVAVVATCIDPKRPNPDACEDRNGAGTMTVDSNNDDTGEQRAVMLRFDLDGALDGRMLLGAKLVLHVVNRKEATSNSPGELWQVEPFNRHDLFGVAPARVGDKPLLLSFATPRPGATIEMPIPTSLLRAGGSVHLGLFPVSVDGVDYDSADSENPPKLVVELR